jgi:hypothetical protein
VIAIVQPDTFAARVEWGRMSNGEWERLEEAVSDDPGETAQLTVTTADNAEYRVRIRNRVAGKAGPYTLRISRGGQEIQPGADRSSQLSNADVGNGSNTPAEVWMYRGAAGEPVTITLRAGDADAVLEWGRFDQGRWVTEAAAGESDSTNAPPQLRIRPPGTGAYLVRVRGARPGERGRYTLSVRAESPPTGVVRTGETVGGTLGSGDPRANGRYYEEWSYRGTPGEAITLRLWSGDVDLVLSFGCWTAAGVWHFVGWNDDISGDRNPELTARVAGNGECVIRAASYYEPDHVGTWAGVGGYALSVTDSSM